MFSLLGGAAVGGGGGGGLGEVGDVTCPGIGGTRLDRLSDVAEGGSLPK